MSCPSTAQQQAGHQRRLHDLMIEPQCEPSWSLPPCISTASAACHRSAKLTSCRVECMVRAIGHRRPHGCPLPRGSRCCARRSVPARGRASQVFDSRLCTSPQPLRHLAKRRGRLGCLILARRELRAKFMEVAFPARTWADRCSSPSGRRRLRLVAQRVVATVHLESLNRAPERARLRIARDAAGEGPGSCVATSTLTLARIGAIGSSRGRNRASPAMEGKSTNVHLAWIVERADCPPRVSPLNVLGDAYVDAWPSLRPEEAGLTFDGGINPHVPTAKSRCVTTASWCAASGWTSIFSAWPQRRAPPTPVERCEGVDETAGSAGAADMMVMMIMMWSSRLTISACVPCLTCAELMTRLCVTR